MREDMVGHRVPDSPTWTAAAISRLGVHTDLPTAAEILGISRSHAYRLARADAFPVKIVRIGTRYIVPVAGLLDLLDVS